ncbi:MAG: helix-turn-helix domain-containing protein [Crocinitomicaceae bacterium]|nr:helix-turn-helix domain-containing protein [Crocinitomicaceae bacterium]
MSAIFLKTRKEYTEVMQQIESILKKSTQIGGFDKLTSEDRKSLAELSILAEQYEDSIPLMPMKTPDSLPEMLRYKMYEKDLKQKQLASILGISEAFISGLLSGRRKLTMDLARKLHVQLGIDAEFLLMSE